MLSTRGWNLHLVARAASGAQVKKMDAFRSGMVSALGKRQYGAADEKRLAVALGNSI